MFRTIKYSAIKFLYPLYESTLLQIKVGKGIAKVNYQAFGSEYESDISDHLNLLNLFLELSQPSVIVELGTRGGESTRVFTHYTSNGYCKGYGVDLSAKPNWLTDTMNWKHFVSDDCVLGNKIKEENKWPDGAPFTTIDLLFIDTSHEYEHTLRELAVWTSLVKPGGWILFHDTNLSGTATRRLSGGMNYGWDNSRGVTRAIEEFFQIQISEKEHYSSKLNGKADFIFHIPWNNGFTAIRVK